MARLQGCVRNMEKNKSYFAAILVQFVYAGLPLLSKASITQGMNPYVFVVYRQAFSAVAMAPFAFYLERNKNRDKKLPPLSHVLLCKIFVVSTGITMNLILFYFSLNYVSATFATALANIIPAVTFVLAVCFRLESLNIKQRHGIVKVIGSALGFLGALLCTFARGPAMYPENHKDILHLSKQTYTRGGWIKGSLILVAGFTVWSLWLIMQGPLIKQYPAKLRLTALQGLFSCITSSIWAVAKERNPESWKLGWNLNLLSISYCGVMASGFNYWLMAWIVEKKGPVFMSVFNPVALIITAIFSAVLFQETLHWGSVSGAILLIIGLYGILWAKSNEAKAEGNSLEAGNMDGKIEGSEQKQEKMEKETELEDITCRR